MMKGTYPNVWGEKRGGQGQIPVLCEGLANGGLGRKTMRAV